jgi:hypothetical protein
MRPLTVLGRSRVVPVKTPVPSKIVGEDERSD